METQYFTQIKVDVKGEVAMGSQRVQVPPEVVNGIAMIGQIACASPPEDDPHNFAVTMLIAVDDSDANAQFPYLIQVQSVAYFNVKEGAIPELLERRDSVLRHAFPLMYGGVEQLVATLTANSWPGVVHLPILEFGQTFPDFRPPEQPDAGRAE